MKTLSRRPATGFVQYPKDFERHIIDGTARFRTKCDMLVGPCSCGYVHQESDPWVLDTLDRYDCDIEPLILVTDNGYIPIPRYWQKPVAHEGCNVLSGQCRCGEIHTVNEGWVKILLRDHISRVVGCPESDLPTEYAAQTQRTYRQSPSRPLDRRNI